MKQSEQLAPARDAEMVADVRVLGAIGVVETTHPVNIWRCKNFCRTGCLDPALGKLIYLDAALYYSPATAKRLTGSG